MTQLLLPFISPGITNINRRVHVYKQDNIWTYFLGEFPIYSHRVNDQRMFRMIIAQLIESGSCRQTEIINTFGVSKSSVIRAQNKLRKGGPVLISFLSGGKISDYLGLDKIFLDYFGQTKSLGAWGGDFILATGNKDTPKYFKNKGYPNL